MQTLRPSGPAADNPTITVPVPPPRLRWLESQLEAAGIPFDVDAAGNLTTLEVAQPIIDMVLGYQPKIPKGKYNRMPFDVRVLGFFASLVVVIAIALESVAVMPLAVGLGIDPFIARGAAILLAGLVVTLLFSEGLLRDSRRWLFVLGMMGLFLAAALFVWVMGVL
jgi:hypothetical protein